VISVPPCHDSSLWFILAESGSRSHVSEQAPKPRSGRALRQRQGCFQFLVRSWLR
jgi:hypothetical protein